MLRLPISICVLLPSSACLSVGRAGTSLLVEVIRAPNLVADMP
jgi:hypothetical protein